MDKANVDRLIASISESYDLLSTSYAEHTYNELADKPFDRHILNRFVDEKPAEGPVCDLGCGPGQVARYLNDAGVAAIGIDLSPQMIEQARSLNPAIHFRQGDMLSLDIKAGTISGITAFYSIVNLPEELVTLAFREMARVLRPGGLLLLAFHIGDEVVRPQELWGNRTSLEFHFFSVESITRHLSSVGFDRIRAFVRDPYAPNVEYQSRRAYIFATRSLTMNN
jgi:SAM-dependent methyltransferase